MSNATKKNRKDHVTFVREQTNYRGDVEITKNRKVHSISTGAIAIDGAGNTRAYNHLIGGNQHCTVVFSLETMKPLLVISDQISCIKCSRELTRMMLEQKTKMCDVQYCHISHGGVCHKNTTASPAVAEEIACEKIAKALLLDDDCNFLPENEAIFVLNIVSDGDTKGSLKLLATQAKIVGEDATINGVPSKTMVGHTLDIGHLIKCISNGFYKFKTDNSEYGGKFVLNPLRIKAISADVSRHLCSFNLRRK